MKTKEIKKLIKSIIGGAEYQPMSFKQLSRLLDLHTKKEKQMLDRILGELQKKDKISLDAQGLYHWGNTADTITGTLQGHSRGFAFLIPDDPSWQTDIFIPEHRLAGALDQDKVEIRLTDRPANRRPEGEVVRIIERSTQKIVGTFEAHKDFGFLLADSLRLSRDIFIPARQIGGAKDGDKVVAVITSWPEHSKNPEGKIIEILGRAGDTSLDALMLFREFEIPTEFSDETKAQASSLTLEDDCSPERRDLRSQEIFTIDGDSAKDFDDAVSLTTTPQGHFLLGVHIADVSNYVRPGDAIDREALERGTSVYAIDQVVPMLPFELSNELCSLKPGVDRLCLSCIMEIDGEGQVLHYEILKSIIHSKARMTYNQVNALLAGEDTPEVRAILPFKDTLHQMKQLADVLRFRRRGGRGTVDFDFPEAAITLDEKGFPQSIDLFDRGLSEKIIEEFMLVANETVAAHVCGAPLPFLFRNHDAPDPEKLASFKTFVGRYGHQLGTTDHAVTPKDFTKLQREIEAAPEGEAINYLMLRTMQQAVYAPENKGHYALGAEYYTHFTSPIRRYPDLVVHRSLSAMLGDPLSKKALAYLKKNIAAIAEHCCETERRAESLERTLQKIKMTEYMSQFIGEIFEGTICSVTAFGFFVQLPNTIEGLVHVQNLKDDYYFFDEALNLFAGERTGKIYRLGQRVRVRLIAADPTARQIDFETADTKGSAN
ncbi:MAG: ribonuclease R [Eubacterium sp.]|nr:ribonuclease R [Eubacterium sp.]